MSRYERTGEYRIAEAGEWFDTTEGPFKATSCTPGGHWILRRLEELEPAAVKSERTHDADCRIYSRAQVCTCGYLAMVELEEMDRASPAKPERPGTEGVVEALGRIRSHAFYEEYAHLTEAIRRVKVHDKLLKLAVDTPDSIRWILEGDG